MLKFTGVLRCVAWLVASRGAPLGRRLSEYVVASTVWGLVLKFELVLRFVAWLTASREAPLGRRVSERVVASRVWGLGCGC